MQLILDKDFHHTTVQFLCYELAQAAGQTHLFSPSKVEAYLHSYDFQLGRVLAMRHQSYVECNLILLRLHLRKKLEFQLPIHLVLAVTKYVLIADKFRSEEHTSELQ